MARRPEPEKSDALSAEELQELGHNLAHLSPHAARDFYQRAFEDCRLIYNRLPSPRKMQTLVQSGSNYGSGVRSPIIQDHDQYQRNYE
jgi:hypothetical protein